MTDVVTAVELGKPFAAALAVVGGAAAAAYAEAAIGPAAMGAIAEKPAIFGQAILMTVIPESLAVFGLVVALMLMFI